MDYEARPSVVSFSPFNPNEDAGTLRAAMKGLGTDEETIIELLSARTNQQRQQIAQCFSQEYDRDIIEDLKSELGGKLEDVVVALMSPPIDYLCNQLHDAMDGIGTHEHTLIEILCPRSNEEVKEIVERYTEIHGSPLAENLCGETSGHFRRLLTLIITGVRDSAGSVDAEEAKEQAAKLFEAGESIMGTEEDVFYRIMSHASFAQLRLIFEEYKSLSGMTIEQTLKNEIDGEMLEAMSAIVECVQSPPAFFATRLHRAMDGMGTDDVTLIRIIVSRADIDLENIKEEYERIYNKTLLHTVQGECSGDYKNVLSALIGAA